jgi:hypothetical protein
MVSVRCQLWGLLGWHSALYAKHPRFALFDPGRTSGSVPKPKGAALLFGFLTRVAAFAIGFDMLVAAILVHVHFGFFMNWLGKQKGEGIEFDLLLWAIAVASSFRVPERIRLTG